MWVLIRTPLPAGDLATAFRQEIAAIDPSAIVWLGPYNVEDRLAAISVYSNLRQNSALFLIFAVIALGLSSIGLYAVVTHRVNQRTQEIGIRMAIGATPRDVIKLTLKVGMVPVAAGLVIGLAASLGVNHFLSLELVRVTPSDPITLRVA